MREARLPRPSEPIPVSLVLVVFVEHVNHDGHDAVRIDRHKWHRGLVIGHAVFIGYKIEPDLGFGADFRDSRPESTSGAGRPCRRRHLVVVVRPGSSVRFPHTWTRVEVRAEYVLPASRRINSRHADAEGGAVRCPSVDRDLRLAESNGPSVESARSSESSSEPGDVARQGPARDLCSAQNQRAACKAAERSFSNTPHCVPPRSQMPACARTVLHNSALFV